MLGTFDRWGNLDPEDPDFKTKLKERISKQQALAAKRLFSVVQNNSFVTTWNIMPYPPQVKARIFAAIFDKFIEMEEYEKCSQLRDYITAFRKKYPQFEEDFKGIIPMPDEQNQ